MACGELVPRSIIGQRPGDAARQPEPAQLVLLRQPVVAERPERDLQRRRPRGEALAGEEREPVEQQVTGTRRGLPAGGQNGGGDLARIASTDQAVGGERRRERLEIGLAREPRIQRLEPPGGLEQQRRSVAAARSRKRDLRVQQLGARLLELVQGPPVGDRQQPQRGVVRPGLMLALCGDQRALSPAPGIGRQFDGALAKCRLRRQATAGPCSSRRALQLGGDVFVEPDRRVRKMPGAAIGVDIGIGGLGQRPVNALSLLRRRPALYRRPHQRMSEPHLRAELDQAPGRGGRGRVGPDAELRGRAPHQHRIPHRLSRGDEKQKPRRGRQRRQPLLEALLDAPRQCWVVGQPEPARELGRRPATWQLEQRQRVAARLGHDPITHPLVKWAGDHSREQLTRITVIQPADGDFRQPLEVSLAARLAHGEHQPERLRTKTARDERQRLRRGRVEPLRVIDDADQRSVLRDIREQTQDREADEEPIRRIATAQTKRGAKRIALRAGKALDAVQERCAQLLQSGVRELHLRLDSGRPGDPAPRGPLRQILKQRTLANPGIPAQHQRPA
jgi:hypothetical protein